MRIGVMLPNWIGDVVMATPTLRALRRNFGSDAELIGIMKPYVKEVLAGTDWLDDVEWYDRKSKNRDLRTTGLIRRLRRRQLDSIVLLTNSLRAGLIGYLSGAANRIGYIRNGRGALLTVGLMPPREGRGLRPISAIDYYLELAYAVGCAPEPPRMELATLPEDRAKSDQVWESLGLDRVDKVIVFNTGGAYGTAKHWPNENYVKLARQIVTARSDCGVLVICGPGERQTADWIARNADHPRVRSMADQDLSIGVAKACVQRSQLMISTDSGPRHFAPALDVPVIALFGPIDPRWSDSHHPRAINLQHPVPCGPCGRRTCPLPHHACMRGITVDQVWRAVTHQLDQHLRRAA